MGILGAGAIKNTLYKTASLKDAWSLELRLHCSFRCWYQGYFLKNIYSKVPFRGVRMKEFDFNRSRSKRYLPDVLSLTH